MDNLNNQSSVNSSSEPIKIGEDLKIDPQIEPKVDLELPVSLPTTEPTLPSEKAFTPSKPENPNSSFSSNLPNPPSSSEPPTPSDSSLTQEPLPPPPSSPAPPEPPVSPESPPPGQDTPITAPKHSSAKTIWLGLTAVLILTAAAAAAYFVQQGGLPFNLSRKAADSCSGAYKVCNLNGQCGAKNDCACFKDINKCEFLDWSCCFTQEPQPPPPTIGPTVSPDTKCPAGKGDGLGGMVNPDPKCVDHGGVYCYDSSKAYCCYNQNGDSRDGYEYCAEGQQGNCKDLGNGSICVANSWSGTVFKITGTNVTCPFSGPSQPVSPSGDCFIGDTAGRIYSLGAGECGQIDGPCGSCKPGCNSSPTSTPKPTNTPTPTTTPSSSPTPTPTGTIAPPPCCTNVTLTKVDAEGRVLPGSDFKVGDRVKITVAVKGTVEDVLVRVKKDGVKVTDRQAGAPTTNSWSMIFTIPSAGEYEILSFVKVGGVWK